jgi:hypothetical protein
MGGLLRSGSDNSRNDNGTLRTGARRTGPTPPNGETVGDLWYDTSVKALKVWNGASWFSVGGEGTYANTSRFDEGLELYQPSSTPYIDFHRGANPAGDSNADYSIRLMNDSNDRLSIYAGGGGDSAFVYLGGRIQFTENDRRDKVILSAGYHIGKDPSAIYFYSAGGILAFEAPGGSWAMRYGWEINGTERGLKVMGNLESTEIYTNGWFRSRSGSTGWYSQTYTGGIWMAQAPWVETYGSKNLYGELTVRSGSGWMSLVSDNYRMREFIGNVGNFYGGGQYTDGLLLQGWITVALGTAKYDNMMARFYDDGGGGRIDMYTQTHFLNGAYVDNGAKPFLIDHPVLGKEYKLQHAAIESPQVDLYYRGKEVLEKGSGIVNIDDEFGMTPGTFEALTFAEDRQVFLFNETGLSNPKGILNGPNLTITCADKTATIGWLVMAVRTAGMTTGQNLDAPDGRLLVQYKKDQNELDATVWLTPEEEHLADIAWLKKVKTLMPGAEAKIDQHIEKKRLSLMQHKEQLTIHDDQHHAKREDWKQHKTDGATRKAQKKGHRKGA